VAAFLVSAIDKAECPQGCVDPQIGARVAQMVNHTLKLPDGQEKTQLLRHASSCPACAQYYLARHQKANN